MIPAVLHRLPTSFGVAGQDLGRQQFPTPLLVQDDGPTDKLATITADGRVLLKGRVIPTRPRLSEQGYLSAVEEVRRACQEAGVSDNRCITLEGSRTLGIEEWSVAEDLAGRVMDAELSLLLEDSLLLRLFIEELRTAGNQDPDSAFGQRVE